MGHGEEDTVVGFKYSKMSMEYLKEKLGFTAGPKGLTWKQYDDMGHSSDPRELSDLVAWLQSVIPQEMPK
jgi:predicted esterase